MPTSYRATSLALRDGRPPRQRLRTPALRRSVAVAATLLGLSAGLASPAQAAGHIVIGASGDAAGLQSQVGTKLARHLYGKLSGNTHIARFVNIETTVKWRQVASGAQDANITRWARALKGRNVMVSFSHEPMSKNNIKYGTSADFVAAWRHVVSVFDAQGSTSVMWVWNATSESFRIARSDPRYGAKWYPGDASVDYVAGEAYNRVGCGGNNLSFASKIKEILAFAGQHNKKFVTAEFASNAFPGRAAWINSAHAYMDSHKRQFAGAFYYNVRSGGCHWHLKTPAEFRAIRSLVTDAGFGV
jgi:hypothetical protein